MCIISKHIQASKQLQQKRGQTTKRSRVYSKQEDMGFKHIPTVCHLWTDEIPSRTTRGPVFFGIHRQRQRWNLWRLVQTRNEMIPSWFMRSQICLAFGSYLMLLVGLIQLIGMFSMPLVLEAICLANFANFRVHLWKNSAEKSFVGDMLARSVFGWSRLGIAWRLGGFILMWVCLKMGYTTKKTSTWRRNMMIRVWGGHDLYFFYCISLYLFLEGRHTDIPLLCHANWRTIVSCVYPNIDLVACTKIRSDQTLAAVSCRVPCHTAQRQLGAGKHLRRHTNTQLLPRNLNEFPLNPIMYIHIYVYIYNNNICIYV